MDDTTLAGRKALMRREANACRAGLAGFRRQAAADAIASHITAQLQGRAQLQGQKRDRISAYWPLGDELDPRPAIIACRERGHEILLPRVVAPEQALAFHRWHEGQALVMGRFKVMEPAPSALTFDPDVMIVPLLAFDATCQRLGYGKGYYDRTLAALRERMPRLLAIGIAFAAQQTDNVPTDRHDQRLDMIITEEHVFTSDREA